MRFDWYQATIEASPKHVLSMIGKLGHELRPADSLARRYRYEQGAAVHHYELGVVAHVFMGGNGGKPHAFASSDATDAFVSLVREEWPNSHLVTRMDAAQDFNEEGAFERLRKVSRKVAKEHRLRFAKIEDELDSTAGRTQYIGSPSSDYRARLYEKGWEQVSKALAIFKGPKPSSDSIVTVTNMATGEEVRPADWVRLELQARPKEEVARRLAAVATPEQAWSFTDWAQCLAREAMELDLERLYMRTRKVSKDEESLRWMCKQYGPALGRLKDDLGDWQCVGLELGRLIAELSGGAAR